MCFGEGVTDGVAGAAGGECGKEHCVSETGAAYPAAWTTPGDSVSPETLYRCV